MKRSIPARKPAGPGRRGARWLRPVPAIVANDERHLGVGLTDATFVAADGDDLVEHH